MTAASFDRALSLVLKWEGGYVDHPRDPGGATNLGITIGTLSKWLGRTATKANVQALTVATVAPIYRRWYWDACRCDSLPAGVDYAVFDFAVNSGMGRAIMALQRAAGVADDGKFGPITLKAVQNADPKALIRRICTDRLSFLTRLSTWPVFGKGWMNRVQGVEREALKMADAAPAKILVAPSTQTAPSFQSSRNDSPVIPGDAPMAAGQDTQALLNSLVNGVTAAIVKAPEVPVTASQTGEVKEVVQTAIQSSVAGNKLNLEETYQSRVFWGVVVGAVATILKPFNIVPLPEEIDQWVEALNSLTILGGIGYAAYGRFWPGLKPLFSRP